jgi:hypothetical protein
VHLTVDTAMESGELTIAAYVARKVSLGDRLLARKFQQVDVEVKTAEVESVGGVKAAPQFAIQMLKQ